MGSGHSRQGSTFVGRTLRYHSPQTARHFELARQRACCQRPILHILMQVMLHCL